MYDQAAPIGEIILGATMEEQGFDTTVTAGAVHDLDAAGRLYEAMGFEPSMAYRAIFMEEPR